MSHLFAVGVVYFRGGVVYFGPRIRGSRLTNFGTAQPSFRLAMICFTVRRSPWARRCFRLL